MESSHRINIFINFEGVLTKPGAANVALRGSKDEWEKMWCWAPEFVKLAEQFDVALVVRSSWTIQMPLEQIVALMPVELGRRVVGAADPIVEVRMSGVKRIAYQFDVIERYVKAHALTRWLAVDDRCENWPEAERWRLVACRDEQGISGEEPLRRLTDVLLALDSLGRMDGDSTERKL